MTKTFQIDPTLQDIIKRSFILNLEEETWTCKLFASMLQLPMMKVCSKKEVNTFSSLTTSYTPIPADANGFIAPVSTVAHSSERIWVLQPPQSTNKSNDES